jgi:hypothetical protein
MAFWAFGLLVLFMVANKLRALKVLHLEWGLIRLEFEPERGEPRRLQEPKTPKEIDD